MIASFTFGGYYHPILRMDGAEVKLAVSEGGDPCGVWVERDGKPSVELVGAAGPTSRRE